jgi:diadenosine tetraphosphate (Ap4A) HIT family hydrolase
LGSAWRCSIFAGLLPFAARPSRARSEVTGAIRINYEILGNSEAALHAHVFPRYVTEPEEKRRKPAWFYDWQSAPLLDLKRDQPLMDKIAAAIKQHQKII